LLERNNGPPFLPGPDASMDWVRKLSIEISKIHSNISMIFFKLGDAEKALFHADAATASFPQWPKSHCRRALALEALERFEDAEGAIAKAICRSEVEISTLSSTDNTLSVRRREHAEYEEIQQRIEAVLESQPQPESKKFADSILSYKESIGSIGGLFASADGGILDKVMAYLTPSDVARLEQTCKGFAAQPETRRRLALSSPLWNIRSDEVEHFLHTYCYDTLIEPPRKALSDLILSVLSLERPNSERYLPTWLQKMLQHANVFSRTTIEMTCADSGLECLRKALCYWIHSSTLAPLVNLDFEAQDIRNIYRHDQDGAMLHLSLWLVMNNNEDADNAFRELAEIKQMAFGTLNNLIIWQGEKLRAKECQNGMRSSIIGAQAMSFSSLFSRCIPQQWPCKQRMERAWEYTAEDVDKYWTNSHTRVFRQWKSAFSEMLQWASKTETNGYEYILAQQFALVQHHPPFEVVIPVNSLSLGTFLMKKCMEYGGAAALQTNLVSQRDYAEFVADYYSMIRLYNATFPKMLEWHDRMVVQHQMMLG